MNTVGDNRIVYGGGAVEITAALVVAEAANEISSTEQYAMRAFATASDAIPLALADNSSFPHRDAIGTEEPAGDGQQPASGYVEAQNVFDPLISKRSQFLLATQLVKVVLKIDDIEEMNCLAQAADANSQGDLAEILLPCVQMFFPAWLGRNSMQGKMTRLLREIQSHMRLHISGDKSEVRLNYIPSLIPLLSQPLTDMER
ncbi:T-complex protein 1 subunit epsilon [Rhizophlyctis rosea]|nr:T-complex protein 1 subunit epsilon [Rhizophlyctis rosea]